jgi:hypothetical protein
MAIPEPISHPQAHADASSAAAGEDRQVIHCLYCCKPQTVSRKAMTLTCKFCNKVLRLEELRVKDYTARRSIEVLGIITVEKKGQVVADRILCGGLVARGKIKGHVTSRGPVLVGPEAEIKGNVTAPSVAVGPGAILDGHFDIGPKEPAPVH